VSEPLLQVSGLRVRFRSPRGDALAVNGLDYTLESGETLAIVGESGSGKSVASLALLGLLPTPPAVVEGSVRLRGRELLGLSDRALRSVRGGQISIVFQDPMTSLNPVLTVGTQVAEALRVHVGLGRRAALDRAAELLDEVGIPSAAERLDDYPHQFSGGMRQRVLIAAAIAGDPAVLVADEATTALDVTTQAQIVELVQRLQAERGMAVVWITHDLGVVARIAHRVLVMYAGRVLEEAPVDELFARPRHPYTRGLLGSLPVLGDPAPTLAAIAGTPPSPRALPPGCPFYPRCPERLDPRCASEPPPLHERAPGHRVACFYEAGAA
jgi:oligopeptide/dipeptide ABC transporter ATP-binding protein